MSCSKKNIHLDGRVSVFLEFTESERGKGGGGEHEVEGARTLLA